MCVCVCVCAQFKCHENSKCHSKNKKNSPVLFFECNLTYVPALDQ